MVGARLTPAEQGAAIRRREQEEAQAAARERYGDRDRSARRRSYRSSEPRYSSDRGYLSQHDHYRSDLGGGGDGRGSLRRRNDDLDDTFESTSMARSRSDIDRSIPPPHLSPGISPEPREYRRSRSSSLTDDPRRSDGKKRVQDDPEDISPAPRHRSGSGKGQRRKSSKVRSGSRQVQKVPAIEEDSHEDVEVPDSPVDSQGGRGADDESPSQDKDKGGLLSFIAIGSAFSGSKSQKDSIIKDGAAAEEEGTSSDLATDELQHARAVPPAGPTVATNGHGGRDDRRRNWSRKGREERALAAAKAQNEKPTGEDVPPKLGPSLSGNGEAPSTAAQPGPIGVVPKSIDKKGRVYSLTGIDNLALLMEDDGYQTACFSVYLFKTKLDYDTVLQFFQQLAEAYPKYRYVVELDPSKATKKDKAALNGTHPAANPSDQKFNPGRRTGYSKTLKAGGPLRPAKWRLDETFDIEENIQVVKAPGEGSDEDLFELCGQVLGAHFDYNKPLWEAVLVHGLKTSEGARSGLMIKIHHAFSDGQGMIQSYHSALEAMRQGKSIGAQQADIDNAAIGAQKAAKGTEKQPSRGEQGQNKVGGRGVKPTMLGTVSHSWHTIRGLYFRNRTSFTYTDKAAKHSVDVLGGKLGKNGRPSGRFYAHSDGISMEDIKLIRKAYSTPKVNLTLNDVACALLSRALRIAAEDMAKREGKKVKDKRVAVFIPVSKRPPGDWSLANYTTGAIAWFRFHSPDKFGFEKLVQQCNREMSRIKKSHLPSLSFKYFNIICKRRMLMLPNYPIARAIFQRAYTQYCVFTNIPGPAKPVKFGEHEAFSYHCLPPSSPGKATMAIGSISYGGAFSLAVSCDAIEEWDEAHWDLPGTVCKSFQRASEELIAAAKERLSGQ